MVGHQAGHVPTQGEMLADLFASVGYPVLTVSSVPNRYIRLFDIVRTLLVKRHQIDIQCLQVFGGPSFIVEDIASWLGQRLGQGVIMFLRGGAMPDFMARFPAWTRRVLGRAHAIVTPSPFLSRAVVERYGFHATVVPNVIDLSQYTYRHRRQLRPRLFWMRTFHPVYNPELAVRTFAHVQSVVPNAHLTMAGRDKGFLTATQALVRDLELEDAVRFPGFLWNEQKSIEGNGHDIFLNTNRIDNMPVSVVEAAAMGLPIVATKVGGVPDLLTHEETGLLVPDNDDRAMAEAVFRLLQEADLAGRLSVNGRSLAQRSSWEQVRPQLEALFYEVIAQVSV